MVFRIDMGPLYICMRNLYSEKTNLLNFGGNSVKWRITTDSFKSMVKWWNCIYQKIYDKILFHLIKCDFTLRSKWVNSSFYTIFSEVWHFLFFLSNMHRLLLPHFPAVSFMAAYEMVLIFLAARLNDVTARMRKRKMKMKLWKVSVFYDRVEIFPGSKKDSDNRKKITNGADLYIKCNTKLSAKPVTLSWKIAVHSSGISGIIAATEEAAFVIYITVNIHCFRRMSTQSGGKIEPTHRQQRHWLYFNWSFQLLVLIVIDLI